MAVDITLQGKIYNDVPSVILPTVNGGTATFTLNGEGGTTVIIPYESKTTTLTIAGWSSSNLTQTVTVSGVTANSNIFITPDQSSYNAYMLAGVQCVAQGSDSLTFSCAKIPTAALTVNLLVISEDGSGTSISGGGGSYSNATITTAGLMSAADKTALEGLKVNPILPYGTCSEAANVAAKTVTVSPAITLTNGTLICVGFNNHNTAANPTLNVNELGAKPIWTAYQQIPGTSAAVSWAGGQYVLLRYNGSEWRQITQPVQNEATTSLSGLMSAADKTKLDGMPLAAYPVGAYYISENSTSPASLFGGTWTQISLTFLWATANTPTTTGTSSSGGETQHTLTISEMPQHRHSLSIRQQWYSGDIIVASGAGTIYSWKGAEGGGNTSPGYRASGDDDIGYTGNGAAHNNMPPYREVYMWKRTA